MKTNGQALSLLCFLLLMLPVDLRKISDISSLQHEEAFPLNMTEKTIRLNMSEKSVDDMYSTCEDKMETLVNETYFKNEINNGVFRKVWDDAKKCAENKLKSKDKEDEALTENHLRAICVYTAGGKTNFYEPFNDAVRTGKNGYGSSFQFHSLHFWLTRAVQILNKNKICQTTYRRTNVMFSGEVNEEIRFGTFASTSKSTYRTKFGKKTCFNITTCSGAFLKKYPRLGGEEQEVLIPPYEKFKITNKCETGKCNQLEHLPDCEIVYVLESTGVESNLDCKLAKHRII